MHLERQKTYIEKKINPENSQPKGSLTVNYLLDAIVILFPNSLAERTPTERVICYRGSIEPLLGVLLESLET